jgi:DNA-binding XRE family transcriptional regulator
MGVNETARKIGMSGGYLSALERGEKKNPSTQTLIKIADALGVPLDYLLRESVKAIIEDKLEELNMTFEELSAKTNIPIKFFDNIDNIIPDEGDYDRLKLIANTLGLEESILLKALSRQEPPVYEGTSSTPEDDFVQEESTSYDVDEFRDPESAMAFLIKQPSLAAYGGYDPKAMSDDEVIEFANELLRQLKLLGFKYKK